MISATLHRLCRNDRHMIRWICGVKLYDHPDIDVLHTKLGILDLSVMVRERRSRWYGYVMQSSGMINRVRNLTIVGKKGPGRSKKTWLECVK